MLIRFAKEKDIPRLIKLLKQIKDVHQKGRPDLFKEGEPKYSHDEILSMLSNDKIRYFVIVDDNDYTLGYCLCQIKIIKDNTVLNDAINFYIDDLCVDEAVRGQGLGKMLYNHVVDYAKDFGANMVTLNVWCCNESAMKFYEKMGLTPYKIGMEQKL